MKEIIRPKNYKTINIPRDDNYWNMRSCLKFVSCDKNICPLDYFMFKRAAITGADFCPYTKEKSLKHVESWDKAVNFGGKVMPDDLLKLVPEHNVYILNQESKDRLQQINKA